MLSGHTLKESSLIETRVTGEPVRDSSLPPSHMKVDKHIDREGTVQLASCWEILLVVCVFSLSEQTLSLSHKFMCCGLGCRVLILSGISDVT